MSKIKRFINIQKDSVFFQSKFDQYRVINMWVVIACCLSSVTYIFSDWYIFGEINTRTLVARLFILIPFALFLLVNRKVKNYQVIVPLSYGIGHCIMWCTIWACKYLPDLSYASDGFIIIMAIFIFFSFAAPWKWGVCFTGLIFVDIFIANTFLHYPEFGIMLLLGVPFYFGICMVGLAVEHSYFLQYEATRLLEENALHDQLTGIYNRNIMDKIINEKKEFICFSKKQISILLFDIDFFKKVNDTYGHEGGDIVLREVVELAEKSISVPHYMIRWGGEEFLFVLQQDFDKAVVDAENIRKQIEQNANKVCSVTVSVGVTNYIGGDYNACVKRADEALYKAKNEGRNCVKVITE